MVTEIYSSRRITVLVVALVIMDVFLLLCGIPFLFTETKLIAWVLIISALIFTGVFVPIILSYKKRINKNNQILQMGYKVNGSVVSFGRKRSRDGGAYYWLEIEYDDKDGISKRYSTPYLGFRPAERNDITCDVYIYEGKEFATNFVNLYRV